MFRGNAQERGRGNGRGRGGDRGGGGRGARGAGQNAQHQNRGGPRGGYVGVGAPRGPPQRPPAAAAAAAPALPGVLPSIDQVVNAWADGYVHRVSESHGDRIAERLGVKVLKVATGQRGVNPHELLAVVRRMATIYALADAVKEGARVIDCRYGNWRDEALAATLNRSFERAGYPPNYIDVRLRDGHVVSADVFRRPGAVADGPEATHAIFVDVYLFGGTAEHPSEMTPERIATLPYERVYWIGHHFRGLFGKTDTACWLRIPAPNADRDDRSWVQWVADATALPYQPHPSCDAMFLSGANGRMAWSETSSWSTVASIAHPTTKDLLKCISFKRSDLVQEPRDPGLAYIGLVDTKVPDVHQFFHSKWIQRLVACGRPFIGMQKCKELTTTYAESIGYGVALKRTVVHLAHFNKVMQWIQGRQRTYWNLTTLNSYVSSFLRDDKDFSRVYSVFGDRLLTYHADLVLAVFTAHAEANAWTWRSARVAHSDDFSTYNTSRSKIDTPVSIVQYALGVPLAAFALTGALWFKRQRFYTPAPTASALSTVQQYWGKIVNYVKTVEYPTLGEIKTRLTELKDIVVTTYHELKTHWDRIEFVDDIKPSSYPLWVPFNQAVRDIQWSQALSNIRHFHDTLYQDPVHGPFILKVGLAIAVVQSTTIVPLIEEGIKKLFGRYKHVAATAFGLIESLPYLSAGGWSWVIFKIGLHNFFTALPYRKAVAAHALYNAFIWAGYGISFYSKLVNEVITIHQSGVNLPESQELEQIYKKLGMMPLYGVIAAAIMLIGVWARSSNPPTPVEEFDTYWYNNNETKRASLSETEQISRMPSSNWFVQAQTCADITPPPQDPTVRIDGSLESAFPDDGPQREDRGYYRIFGHNAPMFRPSKNSTNIRIMVQNRLMKAIMHRADAQWWQVAAELLLGKVRKPSLQAARDYLSTLYLTTVGEEKLSTFIYGELHGGVFEDARTEMPNLTEETLEEWKRHTDPAKWRTYEAAMEANASSPIDLVSPVVKGIQVNMKADEVLLKVPTERNPKGFVPRPVHAVDPKLAVDLGWAIYAATNAYKKLWFMHKYMCVQENGINYEYTVTLGAGLTSRKLSEWFNLAITTFGVHTAVAGDDVAIVVRRINSDGIDELLFIESDNSQHDHTVRRPALAFEWRMLREVGVEDDLIRKMELNAKATCVVSLRGRSTIKLHREQERNTGGVDTTIGNSLTVAGAICTVVLLNGFHVLRFSQMEHLLEVGAAVFGFEAKVRTVGGRFADLGSEFWPPSFLKGTWWFSVNAGWCWGPLLSRLLKISKTLSDPRITMRRPSESRWFFTLEKALGRQFVATAKGLLPFVLVPPIRRWLNEVVEAHPLASSITAVVDDRHQFHKPAPDMGEVVDLDDMEMCPMGPGSYISQMADWYDVPQELIISFLEHVTTLTQGDFSEHPMWLIMALKDYN